MLNTVKSLAVIVAFFVSGQAMAGGPACSINSPTMGSIESVPVTINFDVLGPLPVTATFEYSLDGGMTYLPSTSDGSSALSNPAVGLAPAAGYEFTWDATADSVTMGANTLIRVTVEDMFVSADCSVSNVTVPVELMQYSVD